MLTHQFFLFCFRTNSTFGRLTNHIPLATVKWQLHFAGRCPARWILLIQNESQCTLMGGRPQSRHFHSAFGVQMLEKIPLRCLRCEQLCIRDPEAKLCYAVQKKAKMEVIKVLWIDTEHTLCISAAGRQRPSR